MAKSDLIGALARIAERYRSLDFGQVPRFASGQLDAITDYLVRHYSADHAEVFADVYLQLQNTNIPARIKSKGIRSLLSWSSISISEVSFWLISRTKNGKDPKESVEILYRFINSNIAKGYFITALSGLRIDKRHQLEDHVWLVPFSEIPDSLQKEQLGDYRFPSHLTYSRAAFRGDEVISGLLAEITIYPAITESGSPENDRIHLGSDETTTSIPQTTFRHDIGEIIDLLTIVTLSPVVPLLNWTSLSTENPFSLLDGAMSYPGHEIDPFPPFGSEHTAVPFDTTEAQELISQYRSLTPQIKQSLRIPINRTNLAMRRNKIEDQAIELGIALEALLLNDSSHGDPISLTLRLRGAWLSSVDPMRRKHIYYLLHDIYDLRSQAVHGQRLKDTRKFKDGISRPTKDRIREGIHLCAGLIKKIIQEGGHPDWQSVILGVPEN